MTKLKGLAIEWRNLGPVAWAEHPYGWIHDDDRPIRLEPWQRAALEAWWRNRETVTTFAVSNVKKTGKTTLNAILLAWRWLALPGVHLAAANDRDQAEGRQFAMISDMVERHPLLSKHVKSTSKRLIFEPTGSTLEAIEVDATGRAGSNHLTASHTEAWGVLYEGAIRAWEELTPPPGKRYGLPALRIADSYAGWEGESETWHNLVDRGLAGERVSEDWPIFRAGGLLLFHVEGEEAQRRCFRGSAADREAYYTEQQADLRAGTFARLHLNQRAQGESQFVDLALWDALVKPECRPITPGDRRPLWLGADAGTKRDAVALVGCTYNRDAQRVELAYVRQWLPEKLPKLVAGVDLDDTVGREVLRLHRAHNVQEVLGDPWQLASIMNRWEKAGVEVRELPQTAQRTAADQALYDAITSKTLATYESPELRESIRKAAAKDTNRGTRLTKRPGDDLTVGLSMAHYGAIEGKSRPDPAGEVANVPYTYTTTDRKAKSRFR
jgi:phage terminase large subunit-like protein